MTTEHIPPKLKPGRTPAELGSDWQYRTGPLKTAQHRRNRFSMDPSKVAFARSWLLAAAGVGALSLAGARRYGSSVLAGVGALGLAGLGYTALVEPRRPSLVRLDLRLPGLPAALNGLRIGQLTDSHLGLPYTEQNLEWAVGQMQHEKPDLLVLTGDFAHYPHAIPKLASLLRGLQAPLGCYAVTGNHDHWEGVEDIEQALSLVGIEMLRNAHRHLLWNGADFWLLGIDDLWEGHPDLEQALRGVPDNGVKLLLSHAPDHADEAAAHGIALQLSGHTHGGHMRLPLLGPYGRPRFGMRYVMGEFRIQNLVLYVSRGLGGAPLRLFCRPEATIFTLRSA